MMTGDNNFVCSRCGAAHAARKTPRGSGVQVPAGWRRAPGSSDNGRVFCKTCWAAAYVIRAVALPVSGVWGHDGGGLSVAGDAEASFRADVLDAFRLSTDLFNWGIRRLLQNDVERTPEAGTMPPCPKLDLYRLYNDCGRPLGCVSSRTANVVFEAASEHYRRRRHSAVWLAEESLPLKRFPAPFPVHNQGWEARWLDRNGDNRFGPVVLLRLHAQGHGPRWHLRLACGAARFHRHLADFRRLASGEASACQMDLYTQGCGQDDPGVILHFRRTSGGQRLPQRLMCKLVGWFPRIERDRGELTMNLRTDPGALLVAEIQGRATRPWILNMDHVRDRVAGHARWLQRIGEDQKHEKRWPIRQRRMFQDAYEKRCQKQGRFLDTTIGQTVAQVVGFAQRNRVGCVLYDDACRAYLPSFPWHQLGTTLKRQLATVGIDCCSSSTGDDDNHEINYQ